MRLLKRRAEYEMYADVILVSIYYLFILYIDVFGILDDRINGLFT